jgi:hypothetical protein
MENFIRRNASNMRILFLIIISGVVSLFIMFPSNFPGLKKLDVLPYLTVDSPDLNYSAKVYLISSDKMEGSSLSVSIYDKHNKLLREDIYRQWYCVNVAISWKTDDELIINGYSMDPTFDTIEFVTKSTDFCPTSSVIY